MSHYCTLKRLLIINKIKKGLPQIFMTFINWATSCVTVILKQKEAIM